MKMAVYRGDDLARFRDDMAMSRHSEFFEQDGTRTHDYAPCLYDFQGILLQCICGFGPELLRAKPPSLDALHDVVPIDAMRLDGAQISPFTAAFYEPGEAFTEAYLTFLEDEISHVIGQPFFYQRTPTIRFHFPHQPNFGAAPKWHSDIMLGHPPAEINVWLPLTAAFGTNTMLVLNRHDSEVMFNDLNGNFDGFDDHGIGSYATAARAATMSVGQYLMFDPRCIHATQYNTTAVTRVSVDFRIIPVSAYEKLALNYSGTGRKPMRFAPGEYYAEKPL